MHRLLTALAAAVALAGCGEPEGPSAPGQRPAAAPEAAPPVPAQPSAYEMSEAEAAFLEDLSRRTFDYFWETTDPDTCLAPDRWPSAPFSSIAAVGFALNAYAIGAERGYVTREKAAARTRDCLDFFYNAPQGPDARGMTGYKGFFYHFLELETGTRHGRSELSTVDTTLFLGGALFAQSYFDRDNETEAAIRDLAERIYRRVDWAWAQRNTTGAQAANLENSHAIAMGWRPEKGFGSHDWVGYNEGMLVYILALASPTHPAGIDAWTQGWAARLEDDWGTYYGQEHLTFEPLFGHQYSHIWIDFRGVQDAFMREKGIDYFENSRRATLAQYAYAQDNPNDWVGYGGNIWGWTACDGPKGLKGEYEVNGVKRDFWTYSARGMSPYDVRDDGTIAPTAAGGSVPFAPEIAIPALIEMKDRYGDRLYTDYGFKDAFNPSFTFVEENITTGTVDPESGWIARDFIGIDQGPILSMIENYRSDLVWSTMRKNSHVATGLKRLGFEGGWLDSRAEDEDGQQ